MTPQYPVEKLDEDYDCGVMPSNVAAFEHEIIGHRIVKAEVLPYKEKHAWREQDSLAITLDNGKTVRLVDTDDCCAFTALESFLLNVDMVDHMVLGVGTTDGYTTWHVFCDFGDIMKLQVGWSCGNPFYYGYGFDIVVEDLDDGTS